MYIPRFLPPVSVTGLPHNLFSHSAKQHCLLFYAWFFPFVKPKNPTVVACPFMSLWPFFCLHQERESPWTVISLPNLSCTIPFLLHCFLNVELIFCPVSCTPKLVLNPSPAAPGLNSPPVWIRKASLCSHLDVLFPLFFSSTFYPTFPFALLILTSGLLPGHPSYPCLRTLQARIEFWDSFSLRDEPFFPLSPIFISPVTS